MKMSGYKTYNNHNTDSNIIMILKCDSVCVIKSIDECYIEPLCNIKGMRNCNTHLRLKGRSSAIDMRGSNSPQWAVYTSVIYSSTSIDLWWGVHLHTMSGGGQTEVVCPQTASVVVSHHSTGHWYPLVTWFSKTFTWK